jgi:phage protein D
VEKNVTKPELRITIAGNDVTRDLSPFVENLSYRDTTKASSDSVTIVMASEDTRFADDWYPPKGALMEVSIGYPGEMVATGTFVIDEVAHEGSFNSVLRTTFMGIAAVVNKALRTKRTTVYEDVTLIDIVRDVASRHNLRAIGNIDPRLVLERCVQNRETDLAFMSRIADKFGYNFSVRNDVIYFSDVYQLEANEPVLTIRVGDVSRFAFRDATMKVKRASKSRYRNPLRQDDAEVNYDAPKPQWRRYAPTPYSPLFQPFFVEYEMIAAEEEAPEASENPSPVSLPPVPGFLAPVLGPGREVSTLPAPFVQDQNFAFRRLEDEVTQTPLDEPEAAAGGTGAINGVPFPGDGVSGNASPLSDLSRFIFHRPGQSNGNDIDEDILFGGVRSEVEAAAVTKARVHKAQTGQLTGQISLPGRTTLLAGNSILLADFGKQFDGKYFIEESNHEIGPGGYTTTISIKKV